MMIQQQLLNETATCAFRPIHYLGSKLRLLPAIQTAINAVQPVGRVCDLFAGSGTVANALSQKRSTITVDIQEYSRVLCSALLLRPLRANEVGEEIADVARGSVLLKRLERALEPLIQYEEHCIEQALHHNPYPLCDFIEHGSLAWFSSTGASLADEALRLALKSAVDNLNKQDLLRQPGSLVTRHFAGAYFSYRQAIALDALLDAAHSVSSELRDVAIAPVLSTASEVVNTIGKHFAQPLRPRDKGGSPKERLVYRVVKDRRLDAFSVHIDFVHRYCEAKSAPLDHIVTRQDFHAFLRSFTGDIAVFYADPPYTRDHYSRFYHVLETMCLRDEPQMSTTLIRTGKSPRVSRGFYRSDRHQSPFCIKSQAPDAFQQLFEGVRKFDAPVVLSYSPFEKEAGARPRLMSIEQIAKIARRSFRSVTTTLAGDFAHSKLNAQEYNAPVNRSAEVLIICQP